MPDAESSFMKLYNMCGELIIDTEVADREYRIETDIFKNEYPCLYEWTKMKMNSKSIGTERGRK